MSYLTDAGRKRIRVRIPVIASLKEGSPVLDVEMSKNVLVVRTEGGRANP